jgi:hypothetical protein
MKFKVGAVILAGAILGAAALMPGVSEGRGGGGGARGGGRGQCGQTQQQCRQQSANCPQDRQRLRDGSCGNPACPQQGTPTAPTPTPAPQGGTVPPPATN